MCPKLLSSTSQLKARTRADYKYFLSYRTRWSDNDQYSHINNAIYYHLFDSVVNAYLIAHCDLSPQTSDTIGLVVSSHCQFFSRSRKSSVAYEVGVFREDGAEPAAVGVTRMKTSQMKDRMKEGLQRLYVEPGSNKLESKL
ncbi:hypothetical protein BGY98DRAFT_1105348 [Russula aff. rugulosa BPL654]|nr:hypothetical protein BGY98DRAFT_1105348 [Russula aff. rugulosa BPL654]